MAHSGIAAGPGVLVWTLRELGHVQLQQWVYVLTILILIPQVPYWVVKAWRYLRPERHPRPHRTPQDE